MQTVFLTDLKPFLAAVAERMDLYVPKKTGSHYVYSKYDSSADVWGESNNIRVCTPAKEFLFPLRELAAIFPEPLEPKEVEPFAVFGLKDCDLRSIDILDKVFSEDEFEDPFYVKRREKMFIISSDCSDPADSCFCNILNGEPFADSGFDLNVSQVKVGYIVEAGSQKGKEFVEAHSGLFSQSGDDLLTERQQNRAETKKQLEQNNAELNFDAPINEIVENGQNSDVFDKEAATCVECQACTRICPTCHCFDIVDEGDIEGGTRVKNWDYCQSKLFTLHTSGHNPRAFQYERYRQRIQHKFNYYVNKFERILCTGCGRCQRSCPVDHAMLHILKQIDELAKQPAEK